MKKKFLGSHPIDSTISTQIPRTPLRLWLIVKQLRLWYVRNAQKHRQKIPETLKTFSVSKVFAH
jgi:hypothetical protein